MDFIIKNIDNAYEHITNSLLVYLYNYVRTYYNENNEDQLLEGKIEAYKGYLFRGCRNLTSLTILSEVMAPRGNNSVADDASFPIYVPDDLVDAYKTENSWGNGNLRSRITPLSQKPS